jgi:4-hydroxy-tetrahydrodipicolinate synthase
MIPTNKFRGIFAFAVTPTKDDGDRVDENRLRELLDYLIEQRVHGIAVFGSTGAIGSFTEEERKRVAKVAVEHVNGQLPLVVGTGALTTAEAVRLSKYAQEVGADGVIVVPITYWPLTDDELYEHYRSIATAIKIPVCVYNNPGTTGVDMKPSLLARMAEIDNIRYVKESSGDLTRITSLARLTKNTVSVFHGHESTALEAFMAGAQGWFAGIGNAIPRQCVELFELAVDKGDVATAREHFHKMLPLCEFFVEKSLVRCSHTALDLMGRSMGPPRRPLRMLAPADRARLQSMLREIGIINGR